MLPIILDTLLLLGQSCTQIEPWIRRRPEAETGSPPQIDEYILVKDHLSENALYGKGWIRGVQLMPKSVFTDAYASFLEAMIAARKGARVTQVDLGERLGKTQTFVSSYERGVRRLDVIEFYAVAKAIGVDPERLFAGIARRLPERVDI